MKYNLNEIYNDDSYDAIKHIPDKSIDLVIIDPPYVIDDCGGGGAFGVKNRNYHKDVTLKLNYGITDKILREIERVMKRTNIYIFCNKNQVRQYLNFYKDKNIDILVWHKTNPIPTINNKYLSDLEYIIFARDKSTPMFNTYETSSKLYQSETNKADKKLYEHPTIKPLEFVKRLIQNSSQENDVVADFFLGSGTTCVAAKELNRQYIGFEIDETYYNMAKDRLNGIDRHHREDKEKGQLSIFDFMGE